MKHHNWKGTKNVPANVKIHWIDPEKNLLPKGLLNNNNNTKTTKRKLNPNAKNYTLKKKTSTSKRKSYSNALKKRK